MRQTVVGVFDRYASAQRAVQVLQDSGFGPDEVHITEGGGETNRYADSGAVDSDERRGAEGITDKIRSFFADLFGPDDDFTVSRYSEALRRGCAVVKVDVAEEERIDAAREALEQAGAVDIEEQAESRLDIGAAEDVDLGSIAGERALRRSGVRVYPHTEERPLQQDRQREFGSDDFRADFDSRYAAAGGRWAEYEPAYRYGDTLRGDPRYAGRSWDEIEPDVRRDWEGSHPGSAWERFKDSVRHAWERATG